MKHGSQATEAAVRAAVAAAATVSLVIRKEGGEPKTLWGEGGEGKTAHICLIPHFLTYATTITGVRMTFILIWFIWKIATRHQTQGVTVSHCWPRSAPEKFSQT